MEAPAIGHRPHYDEVPDEKHGDVIIEPESQPVVFNKSDQKQLRMFREVRSDLYQFSSKWNYVYAISIFAIFYFQNAPLYDCFRAVMTCVAVRGAAYLYTRRIEKQGQRDARRMEQLISQEQREVSAETEARRHKILQAIGDIDAVSAHLQSRSENGPILTLLQQSTAQATAKIEELRATEMKTPNDTPKYEALSARQLLATIRFDTLISAVHAIKYHGQEWFRSVMADEKRDLAFLDTHEGAILEHVNADITLKKSQLELKVKELERKG